MRNRFSMPHFWGLVSGVGMTIIPALVNGNAAIALPQTAIPASQIASGKSLWVNSVPGEEFQLINARVDLGTLHWVGDELEVQMRWPTSPGLLEAFQSAHPEVELSADSQFIDRERVACRAEGMFSYRVESVVLSGAGLQIYHQTFDADQARAQEEAFLKRVQTSTSPLNSYGPDPRSLVCWAAARKCDNAAFSWPPPPNHTPLEYSEKATQMRAAYNQTFLPTCNRFTHSLP